MKWLQVHLMPSISKTPRCCSRLVLICKLYTRFPCLLWQHNQKSLYSFSSVHQLKGGHETKQTLVRKMSEACRLSPAGGAAVWSDIGTFCISPCPPKDGIYGSSELPGRLLKTAHSCDSSGRTPCPAPTSVLITSLQVQRFIWVSCVNGTNFINVHIS